MIDNNEIAEEMNRLHEESNKRNDWIKNRLQLDARGQDFVDQFKSDILTIFKHLLDEKVERGEFVYGKTRTRKEGLLFLEGDELKERPYRHHYKRTVGFSYEDDAHYAKSIDDCFYVLVKNALKTMQEFQNNRDNKISSLIERYNVSSRAMNVTSYYSDYTDRLRQVTVTSVNVSLAGNNLRVGVYYADAGGGERNKDIDGQVFFINNETIFSEVKMLVEEAREKIKG